MHRASQDNEGLTSLSMAQNVNSAEAEKPSSRPRSEGEIFGNSLHGASPCSAVYPAFVFSEGGPGELLMLFRLFQVYEWCIGLKAQEEKWQVSG